MKVSVKNEPTFHVEFTKDEMRLITGLLHGYGYRTINTPALRGMAVGPEEAGSMGTTLYHLLLKAGS